jgi:hypothetical protein
MSFVHHLGCACAASLHMSSTAAPAGNVGAAEGAGKRGPIRILFAMLVACVLLPMMMGSARAAVFCATSAIELQAALDSARNNGEDDIIKLKARIYTPPTADGFKVYSNEPYNLVIRGGYYYWNGNPCGLPFNSADLTVIDGGGNSALLQISLSPPAGNHSITAMTLRNGINDGNGNPPIFLGTVIGYAGNIDLQRIVVSGNQSTYASIHAYTEGSVAVRNSAIIDNVVTQAYMSAAIFDSDGTSGTAKLTFVGNTAAGNTTQQAGNFARIKLWVKSGTLDVYNNVFCGNTDHDLKIDVGSATTATVANNDICSRGVWGGAIADVANLNVDPGFVGAGDYHLRGDSPLRDSGDNNPPGGTDSVDAGGKARVVFGTVDIGAHEVQDSIFINGFD